MVNYWTYKGVNSIWLARTFPWYLISIILFPLKFFPLKLFDDNENSIKKHSHLNFIPFSSFIFSAIRHEVVLHTRDINELAIPIALFKEEPKELIDTLKLQFEARSHLISNIDKRILKHLLMSSTIKLPNTIKKMFTKINVNVTENGYIQKFSNEIKELCKLLLPKVTVDYDEIDLITKAFGINRKEAKLLILKEFILQETILRWKDPRTSNPWDVLNVIRETTNRVTSITLNSFTKQLSRMFEERGLLYFGFLSTPLKPIHHEVILASEFIHKDSSKELMRIGCHLLNVGAPPTVSIYYVLLSEDFSSYKVLSFPPLFFNIARLSIEAHLYDIHKPIFPLGVINPQLAKLVHQIKINNFEKFIIQPQLTKVDHWIKINGLSEKINKLLHKVAFELVNDELTKISNIINDPESAELVREFDHLRNGINKNFTQIHDPVEFLINYADNYQTEFINKAEKALEMFFTPPSNVMKVINNKIEEFIVEWKELYADVKSKINSN